MKLFKKLLPFALLLMLFTACEKEDVVTDTPVEIEDIVLVTETNPLITRASGDGDGIVLDCITILYPFDLVGEDGTIVTISSEEDFENTDGAVVFVDFVYPITVSVDDEESEVNDGSELGNLFVSCVPAGGWEDGEFPAYDITYGNSCYTLNYPIQLINLEEETITVNSEEELVNALTEDLYFFVFPFDMTHEDGEVVTVDDMDEIFEALIECNGFNDGGEFDWEQNFEYIGCYHISFPFDVVLADGEVVTLEDHEEFCDLMLLGEIVDYSYPITLTDIDGNEVTANNAEELEELLDDCGDDWNGGDNIGDHFIIWIGSYDNPSEGNPACYTIEYPISFTNTDDGSTLTLNNQEEFDEIFMGEYPNLGAYVGNFPMTITYVEGGEVITLNESEDIYTLHESCE